MRIAPLQTENPFKSTSDNRKPTNSAVQADKGTKETVFGKPSEPFFGSELNEPKKDFPNTDSGGAGTFPAKTVTKTQTKNTTGSGSLASPKKPGPPSPLTPEPNASPLVLPNPGGTKPKQDPAKKPAGTALQQAARVTISKTAPRNAVLGKPFVYDIVIKNVGGSPARNVVVQDPIPRGVRLEGSDPQAFQSGNTLVWKLGTMQAGQSRKISVKVTPLHAGQIGSVATVNFIAKAAGVAKPVVPKLMFRMQGTPKAKLGEKITFRFKISNVGKTDAKNVWLRDIVPDGLKHPGGDDLEYRIGTLAAGKSESISLTMTVAKPGRLTNRAYITAAGGVRLEAKSVVRVTASKLVIARTGPKRRLLGRVAVYQNMVTNGSTETVGNTTLVESVPAGMDFVSASAGGVFDRKKRVVAWKLGTLTPGQSKTVQLKLLPTKTGVQHSVVKAVGSDGTTVQTASSTRVEGYALLGIDVPEVDGPVNVGQQITLRVIARNRGTAASTHVRLTVTLPKQFSLVSVRGPGTYKVDGQTVSFDTVDSLAGKKRVVYDLTLKAIAAGDSRIQVQIQSDEMSKPLNREEAVLVLPSNP